MHEMLKSPRLCVTPEARDLGRGLLYLPAPAPMRTLQPLGELLTAGFLPPRIRREYGMAWDGVRQHVFDVSLASIRAALPLMPPRLRYTPWSRRAATRVALARELARRVTRPPLCRKEDQEG